MVLLKILLIIFVGLPVYLAIGRIIMNVVNKILLLTVFGEDGSKPLPNTFPYRLLAPAFLLAFLFLLISEIIFKTIWILLKPYRIFINFAFKNKK